MKTIYIVACILLLVASGGRIFAMHMGRRGAHILAQAIANGHPIDERVRSESSSFASTSDRLTLTSIIFSLIGITCWIYSYARGYHRAPLIPLLLFIINISLLLIMV